MGHPEDDIAFSAASRAGSLARHLLNPDGASGCGQHARAQPLKSAASAVPPDAWWWPGYDGFGYPYYAYQQTGALKLDISGPDPKAAQVYADGAFVGTENHFRGFFHELTLNPGRYTIQVRARGCRPLTIPVEIQPGRTITYKGQMQKAA